MRRAWSLEPLFPLLRRWIPCLAALTLVACTRDSHGGGSTGATGSSDQCGARRVWVGDTCAVQDCPNHAGFPCQTDGGLGVCTSDVCLTLDSDPKNCGSYGYACPPETLCSGGICFFSDGGEVPCTPPHLAAESESGTPMCVLQTCTPATDNQLCQTGFCCRGECISGDPGDCGGCGIVCSEGSVCTNGCQAVPDCSVLPEDSSCQLVDAGRQGACCSGQCADVFFDPSNCGGCGLLAPSGEACRGGERPCQTDGDCPAGSACGPTFNSTACFPTACTADNQNGECLIGGTIGTCCGTMCTTDHSACGSGANCQRCSSSEVCFESECVPLPDCSSPSATGARCVLDGGLGTCCGPECVDLSADARNCSQCGQACSSGVPCNAGTCSGGGPPAPCPNGHEYIDNSRLCFPTTCDGSAAHCVIDGGLGLCCGNACLVPSSSGGGCASCGSACPTGSTCESRFGSACMPPQGADALCGPAGTVGYPDGACPPGTICAGSDCEPILDCSPITQNAFEPSCVFGPTTQGVCCSDACSQTQTDPKNCGACGSVCPSGICAQGLCVPSGPTADCSVSCGPDMACAAGLCVNSDCLSVSSPESTNLCLARNDDIGVCCGLGECAHLADDPLNCGVCGNICPAGQTCANGTCAGPTSDCTPAQMGRFCNLDAGTSWACCPGAGCTDLLADQKNCGACGYPCPFGSSCARGACE